MKPFAPDSAVTGRWEHLGVSSRALALGLLIAATAGCTSLSPPAAAPPTSPPLPTPASGGAATGAEGPGLSPPGTAVVAGGAQCSYRSQEGYVLPDPGCTPGATNPQVTQGDIGRTICARGWTSTVRPPESYTETLKREQMGSYGDSGSMSGYEEDHLIPLELGGSPTDPKNLWPEPGASPNPKDDVEYAANRAVCDGEMPLAEAQHAIASDWVSLGRSLGVLEGTN